MQKTSAALLSPTHGPTMTLMPNRNGPLRLPSIVSHSPEEVVWEIPIDTGAVYMKYELTRYVGSNKVVIVDSRRFYDLWLCTPHSHAVPYPELAHDYKFESAVYGFSKGRGNPVPLAVVGVHNARGAPSIGFTNGITRTMYLLHHLADAFPVRADSAELLFELVGVGVPPLELIYWDKSSSL